MHDIRRCKSKLFEGYSYSLVVLIRLSRLLCTSDQPFAPSSFFRRFCAPSHNGTAALRAARPFSVRLSDRLRRQPSAPTLSSPRSSSGVTFPLQRGSVHAHDLGKLGDRHRVVAAVLR